MYQVKTDRGKNKQTSKKKQLTGIAQILYVASAVNVFTSVLHTSMVQYFHNIQLMQKSPMQNVKQCQTISVFLTLFPS